MSTARNDDATADRGPAVLAVSAATLVVCTIFTILRLISRFIIVRKRGWDDYTIILAWLLAFGACFAICYGTANGLGRRQDDIPTEWLPAMKKASWVFSVLYNPALMATKTSILLFYLTLSTTQKVFRWATIATLIVVNVGGLALTIVNILQCRPVNAAWAIAVPSSASCTSIVTVYLSSAPLNIITDLAIFFLPVPILTSMRLPTKQKLILIITFGFGIFIAIVDVVRIAYLQDAQRDTLGSAQSQKPKTGNEQRNTSDFSWNASLSFMWSEVEMNIGIVVACVPAMRPLVRRFLPSWIIDATTRGSASNTHTSDQPVLPPLPMGSQTRPDQLTPPASPFSSPGVKRLSGADEYMGMMDFLTSPEANESAPVNATDTMRSSVAIPPNRTRSVLFFDFVDGKQKKNITLRSNRESVYPVLMVTILFFIWGFAYGFLGVLNSRFQQVSRSSRWHTIGQHSAYYIGYIVGPLTYGRIVFKTWGFKACYMVGLSVYACGTLIFWPSAVLDSFPAFLLSNFITGSGLATLELSANPFIALCGPPEYAEVRLNLSQAVQAIGTILSPILAKKVIFPSNAENLIDVQWTYLGITFFTIILAIVYYYVPLPEATDEELDIASRRMPISRDATLKIGTKPVKVLWVGLGLALFSQFCYVGGQESTSTTFGDYMSRALPNIDGVALEAYGHTAFAVSRFVAAATDIWLKPRISLLFFYVGAIVFSIAAMTTSGSTGAAMVIMVMFFEGPLFPQIFAQGIRGMGRHTKDAAVLITAAVGGGAVFSPIMFAALKVHNAQYAYCVVVAVYAAGAIYPIWLNAVHAARSISDPIRDEQTRRESEAEARRKSESGEKKQTRFSRSSRAVSWLKEKDGLPSFVHRSPQDWNQAMAECRSDSMAIEPAVSRAMSSASTASDTSSRSEEVEAGPHT